MHLSEPGSSEAGATLQENVMLEFFRIFRQYRKHHGTRYALQRAWGIAFKQEQF